MAFLKSSPVTTHRGAYNPATSYVAGDGVTFAGFSPWSTIPLQFVAIASTTGHAPTLSPSDSYWRPAHAKTALEFYSMLCALICSEDFQGEGNAWSELWRYTHNSALSAGYVTNEYERATNIILGIPGASGSRNWPIGLSLCKANNVTSTYNIYPQIMTGFSTTSIPGGSSYRHKATAWVTGTAYSVGDVVGQSGSTWYVCIVAHTSSGSITLGNASYWLALVDKYGVPRVSAPNYNLSNGFAKVWNGGTGDIPFWIFANASRVIWVTRNDTKFCMGQIGHYIPVGGYGDPNPYPIIVSGNSQTETDAWDSSNLTNYPITRNAAAAWAWGRMFRAGDSNVTVGCDPFSNSEFVYTGKSPGSDHTIRSNILFFQYSGSPATQGASGQLEGIYWVSREGQSSGDIITDSSSRTYTVFEDVYRGQTGGYIAIENI